MSRDGDNLRKIARYRQLKEQIIKTEQTVNQSVKEPIPGKKGIAYYTDSGVLTSSGVGDDKPNNNGNLSITDNLTLGANQATEDGVAKDEDTENGDDLLTGNSRPKVGEPLDGPIELKDCETGERIDVRLTAGDNDGETAFKHPDDWTYDGQSPTISDLENLNTWESGIRWTAFSGTIGPAGGVAGSFATAALAYEAALQQLEDNVDLNSNHYFGDFNAGTCSSDGHSGTTSRWKIKVNSASSINDTFTIESSYIEAFACANASVINQTLVFAPEACVASGTTGSCPTVAPDDVTEETLLAFGALNPASSWSDSSAHQLTWNKKKAGFFSSKYDTDIPDKFKYPQDAKAYGPSKLQLCTPSGNPVVVEHLQDGGFVYFEDDGTGDPDTTTNKISKFSEDGVFEGTISEDRYEFLSD